MSKSVQFDVKHSEPEKDKQTIQKESWYYGAFHSTVFLHNETPLWIRDLPNLFKKSLICLIPRLKFSTISLFSQSSWMTAVMSRPLAMSNAQQLDVCESGNSCPKVVCISPHWTGRLSVKDICWVTKGTEFGKRFYNSTPWQCISGSGWIRTWCWAAAVATSLTHKTLPVSAI